MLFFIVFVLPFSAHTRDTGASTGPHVCTAQRRTYDLFMCDVPQAMPPLSISHKEHVLHPTGKRAKFSRINPLCLSKLQSKQWIKILECIALNYILSIRVLERP